MPKIAVVSDGANWVLDDIKKDFTEFSSLDVVGPNESPDLIWSLDFWSLGHAMSYKRPVVSHVHHINMEQEKRYNLKLLNKAVAVLTNNKHTLKYLQNKNAHSNIKQIPYWLLSKTREEKYDCEDNGFFNIGSFQKDGQTKSKKPKLIKGPDVFVDAVEEISKTKDVNVILAGYCRDYVVAELEKRGIRYELHRLAKNLNPLYDRLDCYIIGSRAEGGPQSVLEAAYRNIPIVATDVGIVSEVIHPNCICKAEEISSKIDKSQEYIMYNYENVLNFRHEVQIPKFDKFFKELINEIQ